MAKRKTRRKTTRRPQQPDSMQGWIWGLFGLGIGLSVSAFIYLDSRQPTAGASSPEPTTEAAPAPPPPVARTEKSPPVEEEPRFTFYDMLPSFEVVIPEEDIAVIPTRPLEAVAKPGLYVLQAGSFSAYEDADRRRAQLAMLGVESAIQKVTIDDKVYHRVRVGPVNSLDRLNELRQQLRGAKIDAMVIRVGE